MINKNISTTAKVIFGLAIVFGIIAATQPPLGGTLLTYIVLLMVSYPGYLFSDFRNTLIGINFAKTAMLKSVIWGGLIGGGFIFLLKIVPGLSIGLPVVPAAISDNFRFFVIVIVAPIVEEIFFRGLVLGYLRSTKRGKSNIWFAIIGSAILFALAHLGAYISGIYDYPSFLSGLTAVNQNLGSFIAAFSFGTVSAYFVTRDGFKNLLVTMVFHAMLNFAILNHAFAIVSFA